MKKKMPPLTEMERPLAILVSMHLKAGSLFDELASLVMENEWGKGEPDPLTDDVIEARRLLGPKRDPMPLRQAIEDYAAEIRCGELSITEQVRKDRDAIHDDMLKARDELPDRYQGFTLAGAIREALNKANAEHDRLRQANRRLIDERDERDERIRELEGQLVKFNREAAGNNPFEQGTAHFYGWNSGWRAREWKYRQEKEAK